LRSSFPDGGAPADPKAVADLLRVLFEAEAQAFDRSSPLYAMAAREAKENLIPPGLWSDLLVFGFRLEVPIPGFGFAPPPEGAMAGPVERALADFEALLGRVQVELTGRADRGREIQRVCDALMTEFAVAAPGGAPAPARSSDSTRVR
jgi:hypothetical protein